MQNEANCSFTFDFSRVYWNSRLQHEHERLVSLLPPGAVVADVMAGVGPFAVPAAKKGCFVLGNDLNPESVKWMRENTIRNKVGRCDAKAGKMVDKCGRWRGRSGSSRSTGGTSSGDRPKLDGRSRLKQSRRLRRLGSGRRKHGGGGKRDWLPHHLHLTTHHNCCWQQNLNSLSTS